MIFPGFPGVLSFFQVFQVEWEPWNDPTPVPIPGAIPVPSFGRLLLSTAKTLKIDGWPYLCHRHFMLFNTLMNASGEDTHFCGGL